MIRSRVLAAISTALASFLVAGAPCSTDAGEDLITTDGGTAESVDGGQEESNDAGVNDAGVGEPDDDCLLNDVGYVGVVDHELDGPDPSWVVPAHAEHRSTEPPTVGDNFIHFFGPEFCSLGGEVTQEVAIPEPCGALSPAINFNIRTSGGGAGGFAGLRVEGISMPFGGANEEIGCLGDAAFGREVTVELYGRVYGVTEGCENVPDHASVDLTRAKLVGASTCPAPGEVAALSSWRFFRDNLNVPVNNSPLTLGIADACAIDMAFAPNEGGLSIPSNMEHPAVRLDMTGAILDGAYLDVGFGLGTIKDVANARVCLPRSRRGYAIPMGLMLFGPSGLCAVENGSEVTVESIALVDDPTCTSTDVGFLDPELVDPRQWVLNARAGFADGSRAEELGTGTGAIVFDTTTECDGGQLFVAMDAPKRDGIARAIVVEYSLSKTPSAELRMDVSATNTVALLPDTAGTVVEERVCLDPFVGGDVVTVSLGLFEPPDLFCDAPAGSLVSTARIEALGLEEDPTCPLPPL